MFDWKSPAEWKRLFRYYQAGIVNMLFGFGLFALMVRLGLNMYVAQILSHICGVAFNYFTYSRYTFAQQLGMKSRFILSYVLNYLINLGLLLVIIQILPSPYIAGAVTTVIVSIVNYLALRNMVFKAQR